MFAQVSQADGKISKTNVLGVLNSFDTGLVKKDAAAVIACFATNAVITAAAGAGEGPRPVMVTEDMKSFHSNLETSFNQYNDFKLQRKDVTIEISSDGQKATSLSTLVETYHFTGTIQKIVTKESATFEMIGGRVLLTKMDLKSDSTFTKE